MKVSNHNRQSGAGLPFAVLAVLWALYAPIFAGSFEPWRVLPTLLMTMFMSGFCIYLAFEGVRS